MEWKFILFPHSLFHHWLCLTLWIQFCRTQATHDMRSWVMLKNLRTCCSLFECALFLFSKKSRSSITFLNSISIFYFSTHHLNFFLPIKRPVDLIWNWNDHPSKRLQNNTCQKDWGASSSKTNTHWKLKGNIVGTHWGTKERFAIDIEREFGPFTGLLPTRMP